MILVEKHNVKKRNEFFADLDQLCFLSKNMFNSALFRFREVFFANQNLATGQKTKKLSGFDLLKDLALNDQQDFIVLPRKVSSGTVLSAYRCFTSYFGLLKLKVAGLYDKPVNLPHYLPKDGRYVVHYSRQAISRDADNEGFAVLSGTKVKIPTNIPLKDIQGVRVVPKKGYIVVEILYEKKETTLKQGNSRYAAIDIGVNNLAVISSNVVKSTIINGRPLKSINQFANKRIAELQSRLTGNRHTSKRIEAIRRIRNNKIQDYLHKASREVVNYLVSNDINTLIIGKNKEWKQNANLGKKTNQNFVQIPHARFIEMVNYKLSLLGFSCVINEESYTSKCSFLDMEPIEKRDEGYCGKRIKRGLFRSSSGKLINADLNGSLNILRKVVGNSAFVDYPIEVTSSPLKKTIRFHHKT